MAVYGLCGGGGGCWCVLGNDCACGVAMNCCGPAMCNCARKRSIRNEQITLLYVSNETHLQRLIVGVRRLRIGRSGRGVGEGGSGWHSARIRPIIRPDVRRWRVDGRDAHMRLMLAAVIRGAPPSAFRRRRLRLRRARRRAYTQARKQVL